MSNVPLSAGLQATSKRVCFDQNLSANLYSLLPVLFSKSRPKLFNRKVQYYIVIRNFRWSILVQRINVFKDFSNFTANYHVDNLRRLQDKNVKTSYFYTHIYHRIHQCEMETSFKPIWKA